ncbi:class I SAM-dependent methyltransferase [Halobacillus salinarum]|uniref:Class I SAM-dependent methyltransferase n=1 Tax=Halobacillus salinarum TaxID=2932257 RepID=A0ABY4ELD1_9BACI|nr:class I SAM-dependent methyltransferase [Halobacillus salinarum]UOQ44881.1 class I SAM-dependent methyltransferase [Halobacillus salinarum]
MQFLKRVGKQLEKHYGKPKGVIGWYMGEKMIRQHKPETNWSIELLDLQKNEDVLEIGFGAGYALKRIAEKSTVRKVIGIDSSKTLLRSSTFRNKRKIKNKKVTLYKGSVDNLPFNNQFFSRVLSIHSIYFWEDLQTSMVEIYRVLRPGGFVLITLSDGKDGKTWEAINSKIEDELIPSMKRINFKNVKVERGPSSRGYHIISVTGCR